MAKDIINPAVACSQPVGMSNPCAAYGKSSREGEKRPSGLVLGRGCEEERGGDGGGG